MAALAIEDFSLALNGPAAGRVPFRRRQLEGIAAVEAIDGLNQTFAEARLTKNDGPIVILKRASDDFRSGSRVAIRQHNQRSRWIDRRAVRGVVGRIGPAAHAEDSLA